MSPATLLPERLTIHDEQGAFRWAEPSKISRLSNRLECDFHTMTNPQDIWKEPSVAGGNTVTIEREAELLASVPTGLLINGRWREASDGGRFDVNDPATGDVLSTLASATSEDAVAALDPADAAQAAWARSAPRERSEILRRAFDLVTSRSSSARSVSTPE